MKRLIGCTAVLCLLALTVGCGGAASSHTLAYVSNTTGTGFTVLTVNNDGTLVPSDIGTQGTGSTKQIQFTQKSSFAYYLDGSGMNVIGYRRSGNGTFEQEVNGSPRQLNQPGSSLVMSPDGLFVYVSIPGELGGSLAVFSIDQGTGQLFEEGGGDQFVGYPITQLVMPSPHGGVLYGLVPSNGQVVTIAVNSGPSSTGLPTPNSSPIPYAVGSTPPCYNNPIPTPPAPCNGMILSANGNYLYVVDTTATSLVTDDAGLQGYSPNIYWFSTNNGSNVLTFNGVKHEDSDLTLDPPGCGLPPAPACAFPQNPVAGATSIDSRFLFIANQGTHNVSVFDIHTLPGGEPKEISNGTVSNQGGVVVSTKSPFDCGGHLPGQTGPVCIAPDFIAVSPANPNFLYVLDTSASTIFQFTDQGTGSMRPLNPYFASLPAGGNATSITFR
jgi:hypothetical protein